MTNNIFIISIIPAVILGASNSIYWYYQGYRGGKLLFLGVLAFYAMSLLILKLIYSA